MRLFSPPGGTLGQKRAWRLTTPFDRALAAPAPAGGGRVVPLTYRTSPAQAQPCRVTNTQPLTWGA